MIVINTVNSKLFSFKRVNYVKSFHVIRGRGYVFIMRMIRNDERIKPTIYTDFLR
jgi:hypothetical protein